jgi:hypothetical protein
VTRIGVGALAAAALATLGVSADDAEGKNKKRNVCKCTSSDPTSCVNKKKKKNKVNRFLNNNPCAYKGKCQAGVSGCATPQCTGDTPVTCGEGCCPSTFSKCCLADIADFAPGTQTCNPTSFTCCPAELGGGSCDPGSPTCCPPTRTSRFGTCADPDEKCCTAEQGGGTCQSNETCCPPNPNNPGDSGVCCPAGQACCINGGAPCATGTVCNADPGESGCCVPEMMAQSSGRSHKRGGKERFHMTAS